MNDYFYVDFVDAIHFLKLKEKLSGKIVGKWDGMEDVVSALSYNVKNVVILLPQGIKKENVDAWLFVLQKELKERNVFLFSKMNWQGFLKFLFLRILSLVLVVILQESCTLLVI